MKRRGGSCEGSHREGVGVEKEIRSGRRRWGKQVLAEGELDGGGIGSGRRRWCKQVGEGELSGEGISSGRRRKKRSSSLVNKTGSFFIPAVERPLNLMVSVVFKLIIRRETGQATFLHDSYFCRRVFQLFLCATFEVAQINYAEQSGPTREVVLVKGLQCSLAIDNKVKSSGGSRVGGGKWGEENEEVKRS